MDQGKTQLEDYSGLKVPVKTREQLNVFEFDNITKATQKYLLKQPSNRTAPFTYDWFLRVHKEMLSEVWEWAGEIRDTNTNLGIDKAQIRDELKKLEQDYHCWISADADMAAEEITARLHHRLVWIHPFKNGNGRWARLITNTYRKIYGLSLIEWPEKVLLEKSDFRKRYLQALQEADQQQFSALIDLHRSCV